MRAVVMTKTGTPDVLKCLDVPTPTPKAGQVRVQIKAAGLNFAELMARQGLYPDAPKMPCILGYEAAGIVEAVGEGVSKNNIGRRVIVTAPFGAQAEYACTRHDLVFDMPDEMSFEEGASIPVNYLTAHHMLFYVGNLKPNQQVLVHMAAGGVGIAALQLCKNIEGVNVFGTASKPKHDIVRQHGCNQAIDYRIEDYYDVVKNATGGKGVDIVLDALGGKDWGKGYRLLKPTGRLITFGFANMASGEKRSLLNVIKQIWSIRKFSPVSLMNSNRSVSGVHLGRLWSQEHVLRPALHELLELYKAKKIKPVIDSSFSFDDAASAHRRMHRRENIGKVVLVPS
jgi:NADPH:quinone reductase-like Zn-dependent oxidoreductase